MKCLDLYVRIRKSITSSDERHADFLAAILTIAELIDDVRIELCESRKV